MSKFKPELEVLNDRFNPAAVTLDAGVLHVQAAGNTYVSLDQVSTVVSAPTPITSVDANGVSHTDYGLVQLQPVAGDVLLTVSDSTGYSVTEFHGVTKFDFDGSTTGSNAVTNNTAVSDSYVGHGSYDVFYGGFGVTDMVGGSGTEVMVARGVQNTVAVGTGFDMVLSLAAPGNTTVNGDTTNDYVYNPLV